MDSCESAFCCCTSRRWHWPSGHSTAVYLVPKLCNVLPL